MLSRRTRAAATKEAAAAEATSTALAVSSTTATSSSLDDLYCASPKRKDCKLDNSTSINVELNVCVSITTTPDNAVTTTNHNNHRNGKGARGSPSNKGKRGSPQAITQFFSPQSRPQTGPNQCVNSNNCKNDRIEKNCAQQQDKSDANRLKSVAIITTESSPRRCQLNKQLADTAAIPIVNANNTGALSYPETPQKLSVLDLMDAAAMTMATNTTTTKVNAANYDQDEIANNDDDGGDIDNKRILYEDTVDMKSPDTPNIRNGIVKQNTPHRMVITSPVKVTRRYTKPTVSSFSQLQIGEGSPTSKKTATKKDKKSRRRLQINESENLQKNSVELIKNDNNDNRDETVPLDVDDILLSDLKTTVVDIKKPILNSATDPTAQQNTTNNIKTKAPRLNIAPKQLTDYFPIRRSVRKTKQEVEQEFLRQIELALDRDVEDGLLIKQFADKGRGIVAERSFARGEFVVEYLGDLIDQIEAHKREEFYAKDPKFGCYMYYFRYKEQQWCIDATAESGKCGRLLNHSRNGNLTTKIITYNKRPRLILIAKDDIDAGTELTYDYGDRRREALLNHPWLAF